MNATLLVIAVLAIVIILEAGVIYAYVKLHFSPLSMWAGWFVFFLLIANNQDASIGCRLFVSSSSASAIYQLSTTPCFRRKDFRKKNDKGDGDEAGDDPESNKGV